MTTNDSNRTLDLSPTADQPLDKMTIPTAHKTNRVILPDGTLFSMDGIKTRLNNNMIVLATSGGGKTRSVIIPNLLAGVGSYVVSDPKGNLYRNYSPHLKRLGYRIVHLDLIRPGGSSHYNPLAYVRTSDDIMKFANQLVYSDHPGKNCDPFWDKATELLLSALLGYLIEQRTDSGKDVTLEEMTRLTRRIDASEMYDCGRCDFDTDMEEHNRRWQNEHDTESWAYSQWQKFKTTPTKTMDTIMVTLQVLFNKYDTLEMRELLRTDEMSLDTIGNEPTAVFVEISDTDRSKDIIANLFYSQAMNCLCNYADSLPDSRLPVPVRFLLDDFGTNARIVGFENMISNIRSRGISATIVIQSVAQLDAGYQQSAQTIMDNCDTFIYMGGRDKSTVQLISQICGKPFKRIMEMPLGKHWRLQRGSPAVYCDTFDLSRYDLSFLSGRKKEIAG